MRRRAVIAGCGTALLAMSGCALFAPRDDSRANPAQNARRQQLSQAAQTAIDHRDYETARADLEALAAREPRSAEVQHRLGKVFQLEGRLAEAEAAYRRTLRLDPEYAGALIGLGEVEAALGRPAAALEHLDAAIEIAPHDVEGHRAQGRLLETLGRTDEALAAYFRSLEIDPVSTEINLRIATLQLAGRQTDQALARLDDVIDLVPDNAEARHQRGLAHLALKHGALAVADLQFAAQRLPRRADVLFHLALALNADHNPKAARAANDRALKLVPSYADARNLSEQFRR